MDGKAVRIAGRLGRIGMARQGYAAPALTGIVIAFLTMFAPVASAAKVVNIEAPGNLQSQHKVGCVSLAKANRDWTPADLYPAVGTCVTQGHYRRAVGLFALAGVYGRVDVARVSDVSAHDATTVLLRETFGKLSAQERSRFQQSVRQLIERPARLRSMCAAIRRVGPPQYVPTYMIQHGMGAFVGEKTKGGLVPHFDMSREWPQAMQQYLHCPK